MREALRWRRMTSSFREAEDGTPMATECFPRVVEAVPAVRGFVAAVVADWKMTELVDAAELVVSELATNAVKHARAETFRVTCHRMSDEVLRVAVIDRSRTFPVVQCAADDEDHGRGLVLVDAVAARWATDPLAWGKRVWAELEMPAPVKPPANPTPVYSGRVGQAVYLLIVLTVAAAILAAIAGQH